MNIPFTVAYQAPEPPEPVETPTEISEPDIESLITQFSAQYGVSEYVMYEVIRCETAGTFDPSIQSFVYYTFTDPSIGIYKGEREKSYGLAQIHLPHHPDITYEQATDPEFALEFLASNLSAGRGYLWTCYRNLFT